MRISARTFDRFMAQLVSHQTTHVVVNYWTEKVGWNSYFVADLMERPKSEDFVLILKRLDSAAESLSRIVELVLPVDQPSSLSLPVFLLQRSEKDMDIRKYSLTLGPVGTEDGDTISKGELLIESTDGLSPSLADVGLPTEVSFDPTASVVEFEVIEDRVYRLRTRYTDNDGKVGLSDPLEFTSVDDTGPSVPALQAPVFVGQREVDVPPPAEG